MTPSRKPMETYLNLHAHRPAASPSESVVRNYILPLPPSGHEEPEYGQTFPPVSILGISPHIRKKP